MIAIKGKNMPKCCMYCPLFDGEYGTCNIIGETKADATEERAKNCPLVEIGIDIGDKDECVISWMPLPKDMESKE